MGRMKDEVPTPRFFYFDLGKVLVDFSAVHMYRQMAEVSGIAPETIHEVLLGDGLQMDYERGRISTREFYDEFCRRTGTQPDYGAICRATADIFTLKPCAAAIAAQLAQAGHRLGILSNTSALHWDHCYQSYCVLRESFGVFALSYRVGHCKPEPELYRAAAELAGCEPGEIFFVDDFPANVEGARAAGFDAIVYTTTAELAAALRARGARFNY